MAQPKHNDHEGGSAGSGQGTWTVDVLRGCLLYIRFVLLQLTLSPSLSFSQELKDTISKAANVREKFEELAQVRSHFTLLLLFSFFFEGFCAAHLLMFVRHLPSAPSLKQVESDCSSAKRGGDLGHFGRGKMMPSFEKASFALKADELSDLVETDSGVHIIYRIE